METIDAGRLLMNVRRIERQLGQLKESRPESHEKNGSDIRFVIVTKTRPHEAVQALFDAGFGDFGENRIDAFSVRCAAFPGAKWHFIGRLSRKSVAKVVGRSALIHSVASSSLLEKIERSAAAMDIVQPILIQANVSGEEQKQGFTPSGLREYAAATDFDEFPHVRIDGLMAMAPFTSDEKVLHSCFSGLRALRDELNDSLRLDWRHLSMGMTNDYAIAIENGATIVRIGSAVFEGVEIEE